MPTTLSLFRDKARPGTGSGTTLRPFGASSVAPSKEPVGLNANAPIDNPSAILTNFTLMVDLSLFDDGWWEKVDTDIGDYGAAKKGEDGTRLPCDWIDFDSVAKTGWVRAKWIDDIETSGTQTLKVYPPRLRNGLNLAPDAYGSYAAYDASWEQYLDLGDGTDRTGNGNDAVAGSSGPTFGTATGKVGSATDLDGSDDYIDLGDHVPLGDFTVLVWGKPPASISTTGYVVGSSSPQSCYLGWNSDETFNAIVGSGNIATGSVTKSAFNHLGMTYDHSDTSAIAYLAGSASGTSSTSELTSAPTAVNLGSYNDGGSDHTDVDVDEFQLHTTIRAPAWIATEHAQTDSQAAFWGTWSLERTPGVEEVQIEQDDGENYYTTIPIILDAAPEKGDLLIALCYSTDGYSVIEDPDGWTRIANYGGPVVETHAWAVIARVAEADEPKTIDFYMGDATYRDLCVHFRVISGANLDLDDLVSGADMTPSPVGAYIPLPIITTTADESLLLATVSEDWTTIYTAPSGYVVTLVNNEGTSESAESSQVVEGDTSAVSWEQLGGQGWSNSGSAVLVAVEPFIFGGTIDGTSTAAADLTATVLLAGSATGASTADADIEPMLASTIDGASTADASLAITISLAGSAAGTSTADADIATEVLLGASAAGTSTADADIATEVLLGASAAGASTADASLAITIFLAGSAAGASTADADMAPIELLAASAAGTSTADADLAATVLLVGSAAGTSTADASLAITASLIGSAAGTSTADASVLIATALVGAAAGTSTADADMIATVLLAGATTGTSTADASIASPTLAGSISGTSTADAGLAATVLLAASAAGASTADADLATEVLLGASAAGTSTADADLTATASLVASAAGTSTADAGLASSTLVGIVGGTSTADASLIATVLLTASATGASTADASLAPSILVGSVTGTSTVDADLTAAVLLAGSAAGTSTASSSFQPNLRGIISCSSDATATLLNINIISLEGNTAGSSSCSASLRVYSSTAREVVIGQFPPTTPVRYPVSGTIYIGDGPIILTRLRPDGARQPVAEAWALIAINAQRLGAAPQNNRHYWPK